MNDDRNAEICRLYDEEKATIAALAVKYALSYQRVRQILKTAGVWKRAELRPMFLGVDVSEQTKDELQAAAERRHTSMSTLAAEAIKTMLRGETMGRKSPAELLTTEFLEVMLQDIDRALPISSMDSYTRSVSRRRLMREQLLAKLAEGGVA